MTKSIFPFRLHDVEAAAWFNTWYASMKDMLTEKHGRWVSDGRNHYKLFGWSRADAEITSPDRAIVLFYGRLSISDSFPKLILEQKAKGLAAIEQFQDVLDRQRVRFALAELERQEERERINKRLMRVEQIHEHLFGSKPKNGARDLMKEIVR